MEQNINNKETQTYGGRFAGNLRRMFDSDSPKIIQLMMVWCAEQIEAATQNMGEAMSTQRSACSERSTAAQEKLPLVQNARAELKAFALHLAAKKADAHEPWNGDPELFIPGGISSVKTGVRAVRDALALAHRTLNQHTGVPDRAKWQNRLETQVKQLDPIVGRTDDAGRAHLSTLSEQFVEKRAWLRTYRGVTLVLQGVLLLTRREGEYTAAVPHLTAHGTRKKTDGPPSPPAAPALPT